MEHDATLLIFCAQTEVSAGGDSEVRQPDWDFVIHILFYFHFICIFKNRKCIMIEERSCSTQAFRIIETNTQAYCRAHAATYNEWRYNVQTVQERNTRRDFIFTPACILATSFKRSSLCAVGGLSWPPDWNYANIHFNLEWHCCWEMET